MTEYYVGSGETCLLRHYSQRGRTSSLLHVYIVVQERVDLGVQVVVIVGDVVVVDLVVYLLQCLRDVHNSGVIFIVGRNCVVLKAEIVTM